MIDALAPPAAANPVARRDTGRDAPSDYDTFLRMLTVQMQNQDPLNPIDSADYAVQLATFSGVEQQTRTNQLMERLLAGNTLSGLADLAGAVGREALSTAPVDFDGTTSVMLRPEPAATAEGAVLVVRAAGGQVVAREDVAPGTETYIWTGNGPTDSSLPAGRYQLTLESLAAGDVIDTSPVRAYARVDEVRREADGIVLLLRGGVRLPAEDLLALR